MPGFAAFALIATTIGTAQATPAPSPLFGAFEAACSNVRVYDDVAKAAAGAGWSEVAEAQADPRIAAIVDKGRRAALGDEPTAVFNLRLYRQRIDGREVWLAASSLVSAEGWWTHGCHAYDLDMPAAPSREAIDSWVGGPPTAVLAEANATKRVWAPWTAGASLQIAYVPRDNRSGARLGIQGLILVAQADGTR